VKPNTTNLHLKPKRVGGTTALPRFENASAPLAARMSYLLGEQTVAGLPQERPCLLSENQRYIGIVKRNI
jgi:hypothetical protein